MSEYFAPIADAFAHCGIGASEEQMGKLATYGSLLAEKNKVMNLTAIVALKEVAVKHFVDSLLPFSRAPIKEGAALLDIGSGAGLPGLPLAICYPMVKITLLDSLEKRCIFLEETAKALGLSNVTVVWARAEDAARDPLLREAFDFATARAVASLAVLLEYALPFLKVDGDFYALKGKKEAQDFSRALDLLGGALTEELAYTLPIADEERRLYVVRKVFPIDEKYPRKAGKVTKRPL